MAAAGRLQNGTGELLDARMALGLSDDLEVRHAEVALGLVGVTHPVRQHCSSVWQHSTAER